MSILHDIENAVQQLPSYELAEFRAWFAKFDSAHWDMVLEKDVQAGKLDALIQEARASTPLKPL